MNKVFTRFAVILIVMFAFVLEIIIFNANRNGLFIQNKMTPSEKTAEPATVIDMSDTVSKPVVITDKNDTKRTVSTESRSSYTGGVHMGPDGKMIYHGTQTISCKCNVNVGGKSHNEFSTTVTQEYNSKPTVSDMDAGKKCRDICAQFVETNE